MAAYGDDGQRVSLWGKNLRVTSKNWPKVGSAGAAVLPSHRKPGGNGVALRDASISSFPSESLCQSWGEGTGQLMRKKEKRSERK